MGYFHYLFLIGFCQPPPRFFGFVWQQFNANIMTPVYLSDAACRSRPREWIENKIAGPRVLQDEPFWDFYRVGLSFCAGNLRP